MSEPAYVDRFKEYIRRHDRAAHSGEELVAQAKEFYGTSARAVVILQASMVEKHLEDAITSIVSPDLSNTSKKELFEFEGPIGSFSDKIAIAYAFGIFGKKTKHDLDLIRMLRNGFAHCMEPMTFSTAQVAAVCKHLQVPDSKGVGMPPESFLSVIGDPNSNDPKTRYVSACWLIARHLGDFVGGTRAPLRKSKLP
jgi:hypothetical protein